jgi:endonuclease/exonuclease/phosphatase family metal-dependent hydrolase
VDGAVEGKVATLRVAFWNTWLLAPRVWPGGPKMPGLPGWFAPDVEQRAPLVAEAIAGRFDVAALSEVFDVQERKALGDAWPEAQVVEGPRTRFTKLTSSGLATVVDPTHAELRFVKRHAYRSGGDFRDSDTFASKGALLTTIRLANGTEVDVVSTHLIAGGDLFPIPGHDDQARHHRARMAQVDELLAFVERQHDPANALLVVGDLNVAAHDPDPDLDDPTERYEDLAGRLGSIGLVDLWATHGVGPGHTCSFDDPTQIPPAPDDEDAVDDDPAGDPATAAGERIDYLWLAVPDGLEVAAERPRRWAFPGRPATGGPAGSLSDHLALSTTLHIRRRD